MLQLIFSHLQDNFRKLFAKVSTHKKRITRAMFVYSHFSFPDLYYLDDPLYVWWFSVSWICYIRRYTFLLSSYFLSIIHFLQHFLRIWVFYTMIMIPRCESSPVSSLITRSYASVEPSIEGIDRWLSNQFLAFVDYPP